MGHRQYCDDRDRKNGKLTRRSEWFVTKSPEVTVGGQAAFTYYISPTQVNALIPGLVYMRKDGGRA